MANPKTYTYHVYKNGAFVGLLTDVNSDFNYSEEINSAGSTITITRAALADNYGEGTLVDFNNQVFVYEIDDQNVNGTLIFQGFIVNYEPIFTDTDAESVVLTVMGYGMTLQDYVLESAFTPDVNQSSQNGNSLLGTGPDAKFGGYNDIVQSITIGAGVTKLNSIQLWLAANLAANIGDSALVQVFSAQADAESGSLTSLVASTSVPITSQTGQAYSFVFGSGITVTSGATYWVRVSVVPGISGDVGGILVFYDSTAPLVGQTFETVTFHGDTSSFSKATTTGSMYIITAQSAGNTLFTYNSQDPSAILKSIMDNFAAQGGKISYTGASIDLTNTSVTYSFNANTIFDAINKVLSLAPVGWYWYIDQAANVLHFHKVHSTADHKLTLGKNIKNLTVEKRAQDIVNVVYFVGGPTSAGSTNLFNKYILQTSIDTYGRHALVYSDNNVTLSSTAQIIANNILSTQGQVELRIGLDIMDDGGNASAAFGFDIESIVLGEAISFRSFGQGSGGSLWDVAKWDINKWDFDITDLTSIVVQVTRIDYTPDILTLSLSTVPPDITKRVQDIYRNLTQVNTLNNPATPS